MSLPVRKDVPHVPRDTLIGLPTRSGVRAGCSRRPVDAADLVAGLAWAARAARVSPTRVALLHQVHSSRVRRAPWPGFPERVDGDALVTAEPGLALCVRIADCAPVVLAAPHRRGVALVHAGWRGNRAGVVQTAVADLGRLAGCSPGDLKVAIGPMLGPCCYEVGPEFADLFPAEHLVESEAGLRLDLPAAVAAALQAAGVPPESVVTDRGWCTACGRGAPEDFALHSHRASGGDPGRNIAFVVIEED